jgi:hypothetical protein
MSTNITDTESATIEEIHNNIHVRFSTSQKLTSKVKPNDLHVDRSYQRDTIDSKVTSIIKNFNAKAIGVVTLSIRENGDLYIIDGAHRVEALKRMNMGGFDVNAIVYFNLSIKEEAELFVLLNDNRTKPKRSDLHKAAAKSGDSFAVEMDEMLTKLGLTVGNQPGDNVIRAIGTMEKVGAKIGVDKLSVVLTVLRDAYGSHSSTFQSEMIYAVGMVVAKFDNVDIKRLSKSIANLGTVNYIISKAGNASSTALIKYITIALMIVDSYNQRLRANRIDRGKIASADAKNYLNG